MQMEESWLAHSLAAVAAEHGADIKRLLGAEVTVPAVPFHAAPVNAASTAFRASRWRRRSCRAPPDAPNSTEAAGPRVRTPFGHAHDAAGCI
jgi:aspartyl-tRNA synthetase